ncbi:MAG TPA: GNAT family N-acetyltransferase, partial [Acidimicrobiia bacterium]|nr:GNAT family N-acetyltransferase [Acidimicrobiia bacterium]
MSRVAAVSVRRAVPEDRPAVLELLARSLGWSRSPEFTEFFEWKHERNVFGTSPGWVAVVEGRIVGFRTFLRWEFEHPDGRIRRAVRAVDTATAPDQQGRGIFRRLTLAAIDDLRSVGVDFVFNTPNDKSRPGYLKMG